MMDKKFFDHIENHQNSFGTRLKTLVDQAGGNAAFSRLVAAKGGSVSPGMIGQYIAGHSEPSLSRLVAMAEAGNVRLEWLATGEGPMRPGEAPAPPISPVDTHLLTDCIAALEMALARTGRQLAPEKKAEVIVLLYEDFAERGSIDEERVARVLRLVV